jgi:hypothetical protein
VRKALLMSQWNLLSPLQLRQLLEHGAHALKGAEVFEMAIVSWTTRASRDDGRFSLHRITSEA